MTTSLSQTSTPAENLTKEQWDKAFNYDACMAVLEGVIDIEELSPAAAELMVETAKVFVLDTSTKGYKRRKATYKKGVPEPKARQLEANHPAG